MLKSSYKLIFSGILCDSCSSSIMIRKPHWYRRSCSVFNNYLRTSATSSVNTSQGHHQVIVADQTKSDGEFLHPYKNIFPWKSKAEFVQHLVQQIIHSDDGLVVINKPFGVGVINSKAKHKGQHQQLQYSHLRGIDLTDCNLEIALPHLRIALSKPDLVLVKSTERMTSGIAVFADNLKHADTFRRKLRNSKAISNVKPLYNYLVITAGTPFSNQTTFHERVGVQLKSALLSDVMQPCIERKFSKNSVKRQDIKPVYVTINVAKYGDYKTALLEIGTSSVKWNFLRIYCSDLLIPILGDHLYSCRVQSIMGVPTKMDISHAPPGSSDQKLSPHILEALKVRESIQVLPHMHLQSYMLQNYGKKGHHLELKAPIPPHFKWTQSQLNLL